MSIVQLAEKLNTSLENAASDLHHPVSGAKLSELVSAIIHENTFEDRQKVHQTLYELGLTSCHVQLTPLEKKTHLIALASRLDEPTQIPETDQLVHLKRRTLEILKQCPSSRSADQYISDLLEIRRSYMKAHAFSPSSQSNYSFFLKNTRVIDGHVIFDSQCRYPKFTNQAKLLITKPSEHSYQRTMLSQRSQNILDQYYTHTAFPKDWDPFKSDTMYQEFVGILNFMLEFHMRLGLAILDAHITRVIDTYDMPDINMLRDLHNTLFSPEYYDQSLPNFQTAIEKQITAHFLSDLEHPSSDRTQQINRLSDQFTHLMSLSITHPSQDEINLINKLFPQLSSIELINGDFEVIPDEMMARIKSIKITESQVTRLTLAHAIHVTIVRCNHLNELFIPRAQQVVIDGCSIRALNAPNAKSISAKNCHELRVVKGEAKCELELQKLPCLNTLDASNAKKLLIFFCPAMKEINLAEALEIHASRCDQLGAIKGDKLCIIKLEALPRLKILCNSSVKKLRVTACQSLTRITATRASIVTLMRLPRLIDLNLEQVFQLDIASCHSLPTLNLPNCKELYANDLLQVKTFFIPEVTKLLLGVVTNKPFSGRPFSFETVSVGLNGIKKITAPKAKYASISGMQNLEQVNLCNVLELHIQNCHKLNSLKVPKCIRLTCENVSIVSLMAPQLKFFFPRDLNLLQSLTLPQAILINIEGANKLEKIYAAKARLVDIQYTDRLDMMIAPRALIKDERNTDHDLLSRMRPTKKGLFELKRLATYRPYLQVIALESPSQEELEFISENFKNLNSIKIKGGDYTHIPSKLAARIVYLDLGFSQNINELNLPCAKRVQIYCTDSLRKIEAPQAQEVRMQDLSKLHEIAIPKVIRLYAEGCDVLRRLNLPVCVHLILDVLNSLESIHAPSALIVDITYNLKLVQLTLPNAYRCSINGCKALEKLSIEAAYSVTLTDLPNLKHLQSDSAQKLRVYNALKIRNLTLKHTIQMTLDNCPNISLINAPSLRETTINRLPLLQSLHAPLLSHASFFNCNALQKVSARQLASINFTNCPQVNVSVNGANFVKVHNCPNMEDTTLYEV